MLPGRFAAAIAALAVLLAACGDDPPSGEAADAALEITDADRANYDLVVEAHDIDFDEDEYAVAAGAVAVAYIEEGDLVHDLLVTDSDDRPVAIEGGDDDGKLRVTSRTDAAGTVTLTPGTYTLVCTVPGHEQAGMKATLTVG